MRLTLLTALALAASCSPVPLRNPVTPPVGSPPPAAAAAPLSLETLSPGTSARGFTPTAVYLDAADRPIGARLTHDKTGFTFDYLRIESAPQGYIWVNSFPTSDKGEPHTQEHLLLGKGNRGRKLGSSQAMTLTESSAFTDQWRTAYHFHTVAGRDTFWPVFEDQLGAMLDADYTDEEIRREVRNFGVDQRDDGKLRLEEKGTVYNEMVRSYESPDAALWLEARRLVYGRSHPLSFESGGYPDAIRTLQPEDIRKFHGANYHLANMGMIGAFPSSMSLAQVLDGADGVLSRANPRAGKVTTEKDLPRPAPAPTEQPVLVDYPYSDLSQPSPLMLAWPATPELDLSERTLLDLFLGAFAGDSSTTLYKKFIDGKTRAMDLGASDVSAMQSNDQAHPVFVGLSGVRPEALEPKTLLEVRRTVLAELGRIAQLPDGDPELVALNQRVQSRLIDLRRQLAKFLDSPPGFGIRGTGASWSYQLELLAHDARPRKSITLRPELAALEKLLAAGGNPWRARLASWGLLGQPFVVAARPSPKLRTALDAAREARVAAELSRLQAEYKTPDAASTLVRARAEAEVQTRALEAAAAATPLPPLVKTPPMTFDDELKYSTALVAGVPAFTASIDSMQSARLALAFRLDAVPEADLMYLALLPALMKEAGIADGATVITADEMKERLRKELLELSVHYSRNLRTGRAELVVAGAGNDVTETRAALGWLKRVMAAPDWRVANLPRLRDVVQQALTALRGTTQGPEENWVKDPHDAWWKQELPLLLHTSSFLTRAHDLHRLRWQLLDPADAKVSTEAITFLKALAQASRLKRPQLVELASALAAAPTGTAPAWAPWLSQASSLSPAGKALVAEAGKDLTALLPELPDGSLAKDWDYLCRQMAADLGVGAPAALARLTAVRTAIIARSTARLTAVGASPTHAALAGDVAALLNSLDQAARPRQTYATHRPIAERLKDHEPSAQSPRYVGLLTPATSSGVFVNSAPSTSLLDTAEPAILDYLASNLFSGHGAHSLFMKTWAAGLAYSNGVHPIVRNGQVEYYAERCPLLPQTMRFVVEQLKAARPDPSLARYAVANAFDSRVAQPYEDRATQLADELVDGLTPEVVRAFRGRLLALADRPQLAETLFARLPQVYGKVMPGYGKASPDAVNFVIGPARQLDAWQESLRAVVGKDAVLHRLTPRDYWVPAKL